MGERFVTLPPLTPHEASVVRDALMGYLDPQRPFDPLGHLPTLWSLHTAFAESVPEGE